MEINLKKGLGKLLFGMNKKQVETIFGKPNKSFLDEEDNENYIYNEAQIVLTFYADEDYKLGYITISNDDTTLNTNKLIGLTIEKAKSLLNFIPKWTFEDFDTFEHYFNEDNWLILVTEFGKITKIEIGALIVNDEFVWGI